MIVDDKEIVRRELKRFKIWGEPSGFIIHKEAGNGQEALDLLKGNPVDLIITDIKMPKIDGIELLRAIEEGKLCPCVVLLSDYSEFSYARQGIILGAFDYMSKPVNENELGCLLKRAKDYLDNEKQEKERVRKLEVLNLDKSEQYPSLPDVGKLIDLMMAKNQNTIKIFDDMFEQNRDIAKVDLDVFAKTLRNLMKDLIEELNRLNHGLVKFIDTAELLNFGLVSSHDFDSMKKLFLEKLNELIDLLEVLKYNVQEKGIVGKVCNYVLEHVENDISLSMVADTLYMNKTYLSETFKQKTGISFTEYVTAVKMERAKSLILKNSLKSYEIAEKLGFKDTEYFSKVFKKSTGLTPTEFRKLHERYS